MKRLMSCKRWFVVGEFHASDVEVFEVYREIPPTEIREIRKPYGDTTNFATGPGCIMIAYFSWTKARKTAGKNMFMRFCKYVEKKGYKGAANRVSINSLFLLAPKAAVKWILKNYSQFVADEDDLFEYLKSGKKAKYKPL